MSDVSGFGDLGCYGFWGWGCKSFQGQRHIVDIPASCQTYIMHFRTCGREAPAGLKMREPRSPITHKRVTLSKIHPLNPKP